MSCSLATLFRNVIKFLVLELKVSILLAPISFIFIPICARLLDPTSKKRQPEAASDEAAA